MGCVDYLLLSRFEPVLHQNLTAIMKRLISTTLQDHRKKQKTTKNRDVSLLRGLAWLQGFLAVTNMTPHTFSETYMNNEGGSGLIYKWLRKEHAVSARSVRKICSRVNSSYKDHMYNYPLFRLLDDRPISEAQLNKMLTPYRSIDRQLPLSRYAHDDPTHGRKDSFYCGVSDYDVNLFSGDISAFMWIVALVRLADIYDDDESHLCHCANMYRAVPLMAKWPYFNNQIELLRSCIDRLCSRRFASRTLIQVDWDIIYEQVDTPIDEWGDPVTFSTLSYPSPRVTRYHADRLSRILNSLGTDIRYTDAANYVQGQLEKLEMA